MEFLEAAVGSVQRFHLCLNSDFFLATFRPFGS